MSIRSEIQDALNELLADNEEIGGGSQTFIWKGVSIPCVPSDLERGHIIILGGNEVTVALQLIVRRDQFLAMDGMETTVDDTETYTVDDHRPHPVTGGTVQFRGRNYRVATVTEDPSRAFYRLTLVDIYSGR